MFRLELIRCDCCCWPTTCRLAWLIIVPAHVRLSPASFCCLCLKYKGDERKGWIIQQESEAFKAAACCVSRFPTSLSPRSASPSPILSPRMRCTSLCCCLHLSFNSSLLHMASDGEPETPTLMLFLHFGRRKRKESSRLSPLSNEPFVRRN